MPKQKSTPVSLFSIHNGLREDYFRHYFETYAALMCNYALNYLNDLREAEDVVQEVFTRVWEKGSLTLGDEKSMKTYLLNSVRNQCINLLKQRKQSYCPVELLNHTVIDEQMVTFDEELIREIKEEIDRMPPQTRRVIQGIFFRRLKYQEVADELDVSINTVKTLLKGGIKQLRTRFQDQSDILLLFVFCHSHGEGKSLA